MSIDPSGDWVLHDFPLTLSMSTRDADGVTFTNSYTFTGFIKPKTTQPRIDNAMEEELMEVVFYTFRNRLTAGNVPASRPVPHDRITYGAVNYQIESVEDRPSSTLVLMTCYREQP